MPDRFLLAALLLAPAIAAAQDAATGGVTIERQAPPRPAVIEQNGVPIGTVAPGQAVAVQGADVVVVEEGPRVTRLTLRNDVLFDFDKAALRPGAAEALGGVAEIIGERRPSSVSIVGHTDSVGADGYNQALSERSARSVEQWLAAHAQGLPPMQASGRGEGDPVAPNTIDGRDNPDGRQRNRRVDVLRQR